MKNYQLQIIIIRTLGYALGMLKGLNANPRAIEEIEKNFDFIVEEFTTRLECQK